VAVSDSVPTDVLDVRPWLGFGLASSTLVLWTLSLHRGGVLKVAVTIVSALIGGCQFFRVS